MIVPLVPWVDWEVHGYWAYLLMLVFHVIRFRYPNGVGVKIPSPILLPLDHGVI